MTYKRSIEELESKAVLWWPEYLSELNAASSVIPNLLATQDCFLNILELSGSEPYQVFDVIKAAKFPANLFLKHLCVLADYGGEPIQRLGRSFLPIFASDTSKPEIKFTWNSKSYTYQFKALPIKGLGNPKLRIDGKGLAKKEPLNDLYMDMIVILMFGSNSTVSDQGKLDACEIGGLLGKNEILEKFVKERYINVSRITGGATANSMGQLAQQKVIEVLNQELGNSISIVSNGKIPLTGYENPVGMPFDIVVTKGNKKVGIEISFQVTTNSTIERKSGQAADRINLMHTNGYQIGYVLDGAGNFQRSSAISTICNHSDCTVAYSEPEFKVLAKWIGECFD